MKKIVLMLGIVICFANKTYAETWNCGPATDGVYSDSVKCTYDEATKTLTISGEGEMGDYPNATVNGKDGSTAPWYGKDIVHAVIEEGVTSLGARTFKRIGTLEDITGLEHIESVGYGALSYLPNLVYVDLPNALLISGRAFKGDENLEYVGLNGNATVVNDAFINSGLPNCHIGECGSCGDKFVQAGAGCVGNCFDGYYPTSKGYCEVIKLRYTIPEADAATSDDFENTIEWIFE